MIGADRKINLDWSQIRLVVFDVDGTLYDQRRLRLLMARDIFFHLLASGDLRCVRLLRTYRHLREHLAEKETARFEQVLLEKTVTACGCSPAVVQQTVFTWMEQRPLPYLTRCRFPGIEAVFAGLRYRGIAIGIYSDYPAQAKLDAMGLHADYVVCAPDEGVGYLKPHPRGLQVLLERAKIAPENTLLVGDRTERDGEAARRAGVLPLIRSPKVLAGWQTFASYADTLFEQVRQS